MEIGHITYNPINSLKSSLLQSTLVRSKLSGNHQLVNTQLIKTLSSVKREAKKEPWRRHRSDHCTPGPAPSPPSLCSCLVPCFPEKWKYQERTFTHLAPRNPPLGLLRPPSVHAGGHIWALRLKDSIFQSSPLSCCSSLPLSYKLAVTALISTTTVRTEQGLQWNSRSHVRFPLQHLPFASLSGSIPEELVTTPACSTSSPLIVS